ncbi:MAG: hypothetical protein ACK5ND_05285, partial [Bacteroides sp.]
YCQTKLYGVAFFTIYSGRGFTLSTSVQRMETIPIRQKGFIWQKGIKYKYTLNKWRRLLSLRVRLLK